MSSGAGVRVRTRRRCGRRGGARERRPRGCISRRRHDPARLDVEGRRGRPAATGRHHPPAAARVAEAAGVSAQTVYDSVGAKQALVARLNDLIDDEAGIPAIASALACSSDPTEIAATSAKITRSILEHSGDVIHALVTGAAAEPELEAVLAEGQRRHLQGATTIVGLLQRLNALDASIDYQTAVDTLAAVSDIRLALVLRESYGWSLDHIEQWIATTSQTLLLARS